MYFLAYYTLASLPVFIIRLLLSKYCEVYDLLKQYIFGAPTGKLAPSDSMHHLYLRLALLGITCFRI